MIHRLTQRPFVVRITLSIFELAVAVSWALVGVAIIPDRAAVTAHSIVAHELHAFTTVWSALFAVGGLSVAYGIVAHSFRVRVAGLALLATGLLMAGIAAVAYTIEPRVFVYFVYAAACALRAIALTVEHKRAA